MGLQLFDQHTSVQAQSLVAFYRGKWMRVSGQLGDVHAHNAIFGTAVYFAPGTYRGSIVTMQFRHRTSIERLRTMPRGTQIEVVGRLISANVNWLTLDECELASDTGAC